MTGHWSDEQLDAAEARGQAMPEPRAAAARYDPGTGRIVVELTNGCTCAFPARRVNRAGEEIFDLKKP